MTSKVCIENLSDIWYICNILCIVSSMNLVQDYRKNQRTLAIHVHTRNDGSYASRNLVKSETLLDISESTAFSHLSFIWLCPPAVQKPTLDSTSRGRFPKEFAINASSPHCASICFRLSTRGRRSVVETNIRAPRVVCDFLRSCVFPRKWRRIDQLIAIQKLSMMQRFFDFLMLTHLHHRV